MPHAATDFSVPANLKVFVNREELILHFLEYLSGPPPETVLFFHGLGAAGKSLLLRYLLHYGCYRLDAATLACAQTQTSDGLRELAANPSLATKVPAVLVDFASTPTDVDDFRNGPSAILHLQRNLSHEGLRFPLLSFAAVWHYYRLDKPLEQLASKYFLPSAPGTPERLLDLILKQSKTVALAREVLKLFPSDSSEQLFSQYESALLPDQLDEVRSLDPTTDLPGYFVDAFVADLARCFSDRTVPGDRLVLLLDSHDAFWGNARGFTDAQYFERDAWLRRLIDGVFQAHAPVVVVVAGQSHPRWSEKDCDPTIASDRIDAIPLGFFSPSDAKRYLKLRGVEGVDLDDVVESLNLRSEGVHPGRLALAADALATRRGGWVNGSVWRDAGPAEVDKVLVERLLGSLDAEDRHAITCLARCRVFDSDLYYELGSRLHFDVTTARFTSLTRLSVIERDSGSGRDWFRVHGFVRHLISSTGRSNFEEIDREIADLYGIRTASGDAVALVEYFYHSCQVPALKDRRLDDWLQAMDDGLDAVALDDVRILLLLADAVHLSNTEHRARFGLCQGSYLNALGRYEDAQQALSAGIARVDSGEGADERLLGLRAHLLGLVPELLGRCGRQSPCAATASG